MTDAAGALERGPCAFDLVIFDCDGVLVDSERLAVRVEAEVLAELGWPLSELEVIERFVGRSAAYMRAEVERELGHPIDWDATFAVRHLAVFEAELAAVDGVSEVLDALGRAEVPVCVASSSTHTAIGYKLARTALDEAFGGRIFSVEDVVAAKPAPDVFLHAASQLGVVAERCPVVEDSVSGVQAGTSAGMAVFAFAGGVTSAERLGRPGVTVFHEMAALPALLGVGEASLDPGGVMTTGYGQRRGAGSGLMQPGDGCRAALDSGAPCDHSTPLDL